MPILEAYIKALPRIRAEYALESTRNVALGGGNLKPGTARKMFRDLVRQSRSGLPRQRPRTARNIDEAAVVLSRMGIGLTVHERESAQDG